MEGRLAIVDKQITVWCRLTKSLAKEGYEVKAFQTVEAFMAVMAPQWFPDDLSLSKGY